MKPDDARAADASTDNRKQGLAALKRGDAKTAFKVFDRAVSITPDDADAQQGLAAALLALGRHAAARDAYGAAVVLDPSRVDALRGIGHAARREGDRVEALRWFEAARAVDAGKATYHHEVGVELRALGRLTEAEAAFAQALALEPDHRPSLRAMAALARARGDPAAALRALETAAATSPDDPAIRLDLADLLARTGRFDEAEAIFHTLLETGSARYEAFCGLAAAARHRDDHRAALTYLRQASSCRDNPRLALELAALRVAQGEDVEHVYEPLLASLATREGASLAIVDLARRGRDRLRACRWLEKALAADPSHAPTGLALAERYQACGDLEASATVLERLARLCDRDPAVPAAQGRLARMRGERAGARRFFDRAYALDPVAGVADLAGALRDMGAFDQARALIDAIRATRPDDAALLVQLGVTARAAGGGETALAHFDAALAKAPCHVSALLEKAVTLLRLGRLTAFREALDRAAAVAPHHPRLLEAQVDLALIEDDPERAAALCRAPGARSASATLDAKRARCAVALGDPQGGLGVLDEAIATWGPSPDLLLLKAQILRQTGQVAESRQLFDGAAAQFPHSFPVWFHRALLIADTTVAPPADVGSHPAATPAEAAKARVVAGITAASRWRFASASRHFRRAIMDNPADSALRTRLAAATLLNFDLGETERLLRHLAAIEAPMRRLRGQSLSPFKTLVGQILDEARIDRDAAKTLTAARRKPLAQRRDILAGVVQASPDLTLAAMLLLVTLRRLGSFDRLRSQPRRDARIPRTIVQFWHAEELPRDVEALTRSWQERNGHFAYRRFSDRSARTFLQTAYPSAVAQAYDQVRDAARRADLFRLAYLARCGGIYADVDDRCVAPLDPLVSAGDALVAYQEDIGSVGNNLIAATPGHPVLVRALDRAVASAAAGDSDIPWLATGPGLLTRVLAGMAAEQESAFPQEAGLRLLTRRALLPIVVVGCTAAYKHTRRHWSRAAFLAPSARAG